jgi:hypothetical protein
MNQLTYENIVSNYKEVCVDGQNLFPNLFPESVKLKLCFNSIEISYNGSKENLRFDEPKNKKITNDDIDELESKYFSAINNGIDHKKWERFIEENSIDGAVKLFGKFNTVYVGFTKFDMELIKLIKKNFIDSEVIFQFSLEEAVFDEVKWNNSSVVTPSEYIVNNLIPINRDTSIFIENKNLIGKIYLGFNFESANELKHENIIQLSVMPRSVILFAKFANDEFRKIVKDLVTDIGNIANSERVLNEIDNGKSVYCYSDFQVDKDYDYTIFNKHLDKLVVYCNSLMLKPCLYFSFCL